MIPALIELLILVLVLGIVAWLILYVIGVLPMEEPFKKVARTIVIVIFCLIAIIYLLGIIGMAPPMLRVR